MANEPLKGMSMERVRVEEFGDSKAKIVDECSKLHKKQPITKILPNKTNST